MLKLQDRVFTETQKLYFTLLIANINNTILLYFLKKLAPGVTIVPTL